MTTKAIDTHPCKLVYLTLRWLVSVVASTKQYGVMWKVALGVMLSVVWMPAQTFRELLLPESRRIVGVVVEPDGRPVAEASVDHSNDHREYQTDSDGRFVLDTRAPALVVRKAGFQSELIRTQNVTEVRVILRKATQNRVLPACGNSGRYEGLRGWAALLRFPRIPGVKASRQGRDIDFGVRVYYVNTGQTHKGIMHGSGPNWSYGIPSSLDVWRSVRFEETAFSAGGYTITDARGQLANDRRWRYLGRFGESASYSDVDETTAKVLDEVLDGACLSAGATRH